MGTVDPQLIACMAANNELPADAAPAAAPALAPAIPPVIAALQQGKVSGWTPPASWTAPTPPPAPASAPAPSGNPGASGAPAMVPVPGRPGVRVPYAHSRPLPGSAPPPASVSPAVSQWDSVIQNASQQTGVPANLIRTVMTLESSGRHTTRGGGILMSATGALGLMQLEPGTARGLGVDPTDPVQNIMGGAQYLKQQLQRFGGDPAKVLAAYNAGPGAVQKYGGVPPFKETQRYVARGLSLLGQSAPAAAPLPSGGNVDPRLLEVMAKNGELPGQKPSPTAAPQASNLHGTDQYGEPTIGAPQKPALTQVNQYNEPTLSAQSDGAVHHSALQPRASNGTFNGPPQDKGFLQDVHDNWAPSVAAVVKGAKTVAAGALAAGSQALFGSRDDSTPAEIQSNDAYNTPEGQAYLHSLNPIGAAVAPNSLLANGAQSAQDGHFLQFLKGVPHGIEMETRQDPAGQVLNVIGLVTAGHWSLSVGARGLAALADDAAAQAAAAQAKGNAGLAQTLYNASDRARQAAEGMNATANAIHRGATGGPVGDFVRGSLYKIAAKVAPGSPIAEELASNYAAGRNGTPLPPRAAPTRMSSDGAIPVGGAPGAATGTPAQSAFRTPPLPAPLSNIVAQAHAPVVSRPTVPVPLPPSPSMATSVQTRPAPLPGLPAPPTGIAPSSSATILPATPARPALPMPASPSSSPEVGTQRVAIQPGGHVATIELPTTFYHGTTAQFEGTIKPGADSVSWFSTKPDDLPVASRGAQGRVLQAAPPLHKVFVTSLTGEVNPQVVAQMKAQGYDGMYDPDKGHLAYFGDQPPAPVSPPSSTPAPPASANAGAVSASGASPKVKIDRNALVTAPPKGPHQYHGTSTALGNLSQVYDSAHFNNLYGPGFYTTDNLGVAESYTKKGKGTTPAVYHVEWAGPKPPKMIDLNQPLPADAFKAVKSAISEYLNGDADPSRPGRLLYQDLKEGMEYEGLTTHEAQEVMHDLSDELHGMGYDGFAHVGGVGKTPHNVEIYFHPIEPVYTQRHADGTVTSHGGQANIKLTKIDPASLPSSQSGTSASAVSVPDVSRSEGTAFTSGNEPIGYHWALKDAKDLITSHDSNFSPNPDFDQSLQPRDRSRVASADQVRAMSQTLNPSRLAESHSTSDGAPIVGPDGMVESGNARTMAIRSAYDNNLPTADAYRKFVEGKAKELGAAGHDRRLENPVLVRVRHSPTNDRAGLADRMGKSSVAKMSDTETAVGDGKMLRESDMINLIVPNDDGNLATASNRDFVRAFLGSLDPGERADLVDSHGVVSSAGLTRMRNAVLAAAYDDPTVISRLTESTDSNVRGIGTAMINTAPKMAALRRKIELGERHDLDITSDITSAVNKLSHLRGQGVSVAEHLGTLSMFGSDLSPIAEDLLKFFDKNNRSSGKISELLNAYADAADVTGDPRNGKLFESDDPTKEEVYAAARKAIGDAIQTGQSAMDFSGESPAPSRGQDRPANAGETANPDQTVTKDLANAAPAKGGVSDSRPDASSSEIPTPYTFAEHNATMKRMAAGDITADEVRKRFEAVVAHKAQILADLGQFKVDDLKKMVGGYTYSGAKKADLIEQVYREIQDRHAMGQMYSYSMGKDARLNALRKVVASLTDEDIQKHAAGIKERQTAFTKAMTNPETLDEYRQFVDRRGAAALTSEQKIKWDELRAAASKSSGAPAATVVPKADLGDVKITVKEAVHTKGGHAIWIAQPSARVERAAYDDLNAKAKALGGYYSSFGPKENHGFIFKSKDAADKFSALQHGDVSNADLVEAKQQEAQASAATRLRTIADRMATAADERLNADRKTNTHKRATEAAYAEESARKDKAMAATLHNIADALDSGEANHLEGVKARTHVETLESVLQQAKYTAGRAAGIRSDVTQERGPAMTDIEHATYPYPVVYDNALRDLSRALEAAPGKKRLAASVLKLNAAIGRTGEIRTSSDIDMIREGAKAAAIAPNGKHISSSVLDRIQSYDRLQAMGIKTPAGLRAALREYLPLRAQASGANPIKVLERGLIGRKIAGYFPTPTDLSRDAVSAADIKPGMETLEPSAGKGNIADVIKSEHPDANLSTIEPVADLRGILRAKGHNLVDSDFLEHTGKTYDRIVMNPPFENGQDITHVQHAYDLLKPGGRVVAIMSEGSFSRNDKQATAFRDWLDQKGGASEKLPDGSFKSSERPTGVATRIVTLNKPKAAAPDGAPDARTPQATRTPGRKMESGAVNLQSWEKIGRFLAHGAGDAKAAAFDTILGNGHMLQRYASPSTVMAFRELAGVGGQVAALLQGPGVEIHKLMKDEGGIERFIAALDEGRLRGIRENWDDLAARAWTDDVTRDATEDGQPDLRVHLSFLAPLTALSNASERFAGANATGQMLARRAHDQGTDGALRHYLATTFAKARDNVATILGIDKNGADQFHETIQKPGFKAAIKIYKDKIEPELRRAHIEGEGDDAHFSNRLGALGTYYPLIRVDENGNTYGGLSNAYATGQADDYDTSVEGLRTKLKAALGKNAAAKLIDGLLKDGLVKPTARPKGHKGPYTHPDVTEETTAGHGPHYTVKVGGRPFPGREVPIGKDRIVADPEKSEPMHIPAPTVIAPSWLIKSLGPAISNRLPAWGGQAPDARGGIRGGLNALNGIGMQGPLDLAYHTHNLIATVASEATLGGKPVSKLIANTPVTKMAATALALGRTDPSSALNQDHLITLGKLGLLPDRFGDLTHDESIANATGAEYVPWKGFHQKPDKTTTSGTTTATTPGAKAFSFPTMAPEVFGRTGLDARARILMLQHAMNMEGMDPNKPWPKDADGNLLHPEKAMRVARTVEHLGSYVRAMEASTVRFLKDNKIGPFATASSTMLRNGARSWLNWKLFVKGALGVLATWAIIYHMQTGKYPQDDPSSRFLHTAPLQGKGVPAILKGKSVNVGALLNPMVDRGATALGIRQAYDTHQKTGSTDRAEEAAVKAWLNAGARPALGPAVTAGIRGVGMVDPYLTGLRNQRTGKPEPSFLPVVQKEDPGFALGQHLTAGALGVNSSIERAAAASGFAPAIADTHEENMTSADRWLEVVMGLGMPNVLKDDNKTYGSGGGRGHRGSGPPLPPMPPAPRMPRLP